MSGSPVEAEKFLLGSILLDNSVVPLISQIVKPEDFSTDLNSNIYSSCIKLHNADKPIDVATILYAMRDTSRYTDDVNEIVMYLMNLTSLVPSAINCKHYAKIIKNDSIRRKLNSFANALQAMTSSPVIDANELASKMVQELSEVSDDIIEDNCCDLKEAMRQACEQLEETVQNGGKLPGIETGFVDLDSFLCGLREGSLTIIAGRPAMGKTAFVTNILENVCIKNNIPAIMFSLEMTKIELANRIISSGSRISGSEIRLGNLTTEQWNSYLNVVESNSSAPLFIDDTGGISIALLADRAKHWKKIKDIKLVVVDYLQLVSATSKKTTTREQEVSEVARGLKTLAKTLSVPVIALAQLNRSVESRSEKRPVLSDLRESGSIEQDADNVLFIHRPGYYDKTERQDLAEIIIAKQRGGPTGIVNLKWIGRLTRFTDEIKDKHVHETFDDVEDTDW